MYVGLKCIKIYHFLIVIFHWNDLRTHEIIIMPRMIKQQHTYYFYIIEFYLENRISKEFRWKFNDDLASIKHFIGETCKSHFCSDERIVVSTAQR